MTKGFFLLVCIVYIYSSGSLRRTEYYYHYYCYISDTWSELSYIPYCWGSLCLPLPHFQNSGRSAIAKPLHRRSLLMRVGLMITKSLPLVRKKQQRFQMMIHVGICESCAWWGWKKGGKYVGGVHGCGIGQVPKIYFLVVKRSDLYRFRDEKIIKNTNKNMQSIEEREWWMTLTKYNMWPLFDGVGRWESARNANIIFNPRSLYERGITQTRKGSSVCNSLRIGHSRESK